MIDVFGDSTRDGEWASVRLLVDGDRIVEADAPGLERPLAGLTLLEAAAVGGETLAADALANALGPVFRAEPQTGRTAVAMSGGVDSAVALLRGGREAVGVTLRLWLDPAGSTLTSTARPQSSGIAHRRSGRGCLRVPAASSSSSTSRPTASRAARPPFSTKAMPSWAAVSSRPPPVTKIGHGCSSPHSRGGISGDSRSQSSSSPLDCPLRTSSCAWAEPSAAFLRSSREQNERFCP